MSNFTVVECEQRSELWFAARVGVLTATGAADMLAKPLRSGGEPACRRDLRVRLAIERLTGQAAEDAAFVSADMRRGTELEPEAFAAYEAATGQLVQQVGFVRHNAFPIGCSPDGVIGDFEGGVELKCPKAATHLGYWRNAGQVPPEYLPQITHTLFVTGAPWWDFVSYDPRFPEPLRLYRVRVNASDVDLANYTKALASFLVEIDVEYGEVSAMVTARTEATCQA
jgi:hypothetical protein